MSDVPAHCSNCGKPLTGPYCARCGQKAQDHKRPLHTFFGELWGGLFTLDSRFWKTIRVLLTKPGFLTNAYNVGQRVRYVRPLRLYVILSIILFALLSLLDVEVIQIGAAPASQASATDSLAVVPLDSTPVVSAPDKAPSPPSVRRVFFVEASKQVEALNADFMTRFPQVMFLLVPVFAGLVKLCYRKAGVYYMEHLIFALHIHAFAYIMLSLASLWTLVWGSDHSGLMIFVVGILVYVWLSLRKVYHEDYLWTTLKMVILLFTYLVSLVIGVLLTVLGLAVVRTFPALWHAL